MRAVITFLVVATALVALAWWMAGLPGSITIEIGSFGLSAPTPVALLAAVVLFFAIYIVIRLLATVLRLPGRTRRIQAARARKKGDAAVSRTLLALAGGDADTASREARRGRALLGDTPQTLLLVAYAARLGGDQDQADEAFGLLAERKDAAFLGLRGLLQGAVARGDWAAAQALAAQAAEINPSAPWIRAERERLAIRSGSWREALALSGPGSPVAAFGTAAAESETDADQSRRLAQDAYKADPAFAPAALAYVQRLREAGREKKAQEVLRESWSRSPHPAIGAASLAGGGFMSPESRADWLTASNPTHPESLVLRAQAALDGGNTAKARQLAEQARDGGMDERRLWLLLASICADEHDEAGQSDALRRAANAPVGPGWQCDACATPYGDWQPVCSKCGEAGKITWGVHPGGHSPTALAADAYAILP